MSEFPSTTWEDDPAALFDRFARYYDGDYRHYDQDLQLIMDLAQEGDGSLLELGCGTGRVLLPLALAGHTGVGIDISPALLGRARDKLAAAGVGGRFSLVQSSMDGFDLPVKEFDLAVCVSNTFMHLTTAAAQRAALNRAAAHLRAGGGLLLDLFNPDISRLLQVEGMQELADVWTQDDGTTVHKWVVRRLDLARQLQDTLFLYEELQPDGRLLRTACPFVLRYLWRHEGELMLEQAGFEVEAVWGDFDGNPYEDGSERLIFLARKPCALR